MLISIHITITLFLLAALHLHYNTKGRMLINKIFGVALWIVLLHNLCIFPIWLLSLENYSQLYHAAPFYLFYGPLLYLYFQGNVKEKISRKSLILNGIPVVIGWIAFFIFAFNPEIRLQTRSFYYPILYSCMGISLITYSVVILISERQTVYYAKYLYFAWYCVLYGLFILLMVSKMALYTNQYDRLITENIRIIADLLLLFGVLILFTESFQCFKSRFMMKYKPPKLKTASYTRKKTRGEQLAETVQHNKEIEELQMLDIYFSSNAIQDVKLNLKTAASHLRITQKTLSELIFKLYGTTFTKLLTKKRIEYACWVLLSPEFDDTYEKLSNVCGFKSIASFYRNFRALLHCSPTEFRHRHLKTAN